MNPTPHQENSAMTSDPSELQAIKNRLSTLEAQNRRLKWSGLSLLAVLSAFVLMGQTAPTPQVIEAQRFVLKDAKGNVRAWLGLFGKGSEIILGDTNKEPKMTLKVSEDASDLHFYGGEHSGMNLGVDLGYPAISMAGTDGNGRVDIAVSTSGPAIKAQDEKGFSTILGAAQLKASPGAQAKQTSGASVILLDTSGKIIWKAP
jgi:hypothetical protein